MHQTAPVPRLIDTECRRLEMLALEGEHLNPQASALLLAELERAILFPATELPPATVTMNAEVDYVDEGSGVQRSVRLVYPNEADVARGCISILTPVAAGLIGLTVGDRIEWPDRQGRTHMLRIVKVAAPEMGPDAGETA
jgi:regulator of nucleoside diphosphate kinase